MAAWVKSKNVVADTVVPMHVSLAVDGDRLVLRQHFAPGLAVAVVCPVIPIETAPENRSSAFVQILLCDDGIVKTFHVHQTDGVIGFVCDFYCITPPLLFVLMLAALFGCGLFFDLLDTKRELIWVSWLVHLFANLAINTIGMKLLGMF